MNPAIKQFLDSLTSEELDQVRSYLATPLVSPILDESCKKNDKFFNYERIKELLQEANPNQNITLDIAKQWRKASNIRLKDLVPFQTGKPLIELDPAAIPKAIYITNDHWNTPTAPSQVAAHRRFLWPDKDNRFKPTREGIQLGIPNRSVPYIITPDRPEFITEIPQEILNTLKTQIKPRHIHNNQYRYGLISLEVFLTFGKLVQVTKQELPPISHFQK